jgi:hypothetical protein
MNPTTKSPNGASRVVAERQNFKFLLATNPNYFGNLKGSLYKPVKKIVGDVTYEEIKCLSFDHERNLLEATVHIKRPTGYKGDLCHDGSTEYVRFYLDYGSGWEDQGVGSFNAHDIPNSNDCAKQSTKPLVYVVTLPIDPKKRCCDHPVTPKVRAILSWETAPPAGTPGFPPVWGNVLERNIQIKPHSWNIFCLLESIGGSIGQKLKVPTLFEEVQFNPIPLPDPPPETLPTLAKLYGYGTAGKKTAASDAKKTVEPHRFGLAHIETALLQGGVDQLAIETQIQSWEKLGLNWQAALAALSKTKANVTYEEVECLGLDYNREWLVATINVKKPSGYSGNLCSAGSNEYVAFWADWDDTCTWTYLGTVQVNVHDIQKFPAGGIRYAAILPVNLSQVRQHCAKPKIGRVRAVLSWQSPPSTTDPDALNYWGNRIDTHVQIRPGSPITEPSATIRSLGGIPIENIDVFGDGMTQMFGAIPAKFWYNDAPADAWGLNRDCPFGGTVLVHGMWFPGYKYRIRARKVLNPGFIVTLTTSFNLTKWTPGFTTQNPDSTNPADPGYGFFNYLDPSLYFENNMLGVWPTSGDEQWEVSLDIANGVYTVLGSTPWYRLQLDNSAPTVDLHIDSGGDCKGFAKNDVLHGHFVARDLHFGGFGLSTHPNTAAIPSNQPTTPTPNTTQTAVAPGDPWSLDLGNPVKMKSCGYVVRVDVWDRTIVGSQSNSHNYDYTETGFYILP